MVQTLEHSSIFIPVSMSSIAWGRSSDNPRVFPYLLFDNKQMYHSSAIVAAAMETITIPCCLDTNPWHMWDMIVPHTSLGRKVHCFIMMLILIILMICRSLLCHVVYHFHWSPTATCRTALLAAVLMIILCHCYLTQPWIRTSVYKTLFS